jgi:DNA replication and repair protein RecF
MWLRKITAGNFKNYELAEAEFVSGLNILYGDNGSGKTNILDAIHYLCLCKSFLNPADSQNIRHGEEMFYLEGVFTVENEETENTVQCGFKRDKKKQIKLNKKEYDRLADHIGYIPLVVISPADSILITGNSDERRKFIDALISIYDRQYLENLISYNRLLQQRNAMLKQFWEQNHFNLEMLEIYDMQMADPANYIYKQRSKLMETFIPVFQDHYNYISDRKETVRLEYQSCLTDGRSLTDHLNETLQRDKKLLYTSTGIHKDDLLFLLEDMPIKKIGSQGQQKSYLTALKTAKYDVLKEQTGKKPILLLDDIFDKLDDKRVERLIMKVSDKNYGQVFITHTGHHKIEEILHQHQIQYKLLMVSNNKIVTP